ncbi:hypothetical protein AAFF_G00123130 [Aldrovandia affinis]|uniref:Protein NATD1 n=1 Tax=Aldrovandia affinis TaxID=143900 RepID=A0AAD7RRW8_9TELE|nr:hypothetical protein AAFF_G00123130 [Aldrovandia affinis]
MKFLQDLHKDYMKDCDRNHILSYRQFTSLESKVPKIEHDRHRTCFTIRLGNAGRQETAILKYEFTGDREVHLLTTNVPVEFRGKGVAALLAKTAMDFVVEENLKARVSCWYIKKYIAENPMTDYKEQIVD